MFFYPDATYDKAIRERDTDALKALLVGIIGSDPTFVTSEFDEAWTYIHEQSMKVNGEKIILEESYEKQEDEYEQSEWDELYFQMNLVWLRDNFALSKRLPDIRKIGEFVYKDKPTFGKMKYRSRHHSTPDADHNNDRKLKSKKNSVVRPPGDDNQEKRLKDGLCVKNNWYWILFAAVILALLLLFLKITAQNDSSIEKNSDTAIPNSIDTEINEEEFYNETSYFIPDSNMEEQFIYGGEIVYG